MMLQPAVLEALRKCRWVHTLGMSSECEGCANDGELGYCKGAGIGGWQGGDGDDLWCHCGHGVTLVEVPTECECSGPEGWHCQGEEGQHWTTDEDPEKAECGYCGWYPYPKDDDEDTL